MIRNCDIQVGALVVEKATKTDHQTWLGYAKYSPLFSGPLKKNQRNRKSKKSEYPVFFFNTYYTYEAFHQF